jgi:hypothetical protein
MSRNRVLTLKLLIGLLYIATAIAGLFWAIRLYLMGMYDAPFCWWYPVMLIGSLSLLVGAVLSWFSLRGWVQWLPLLGSVVLAAYFVPAIIETMRAYFKGEVVGGTQLLVRLIPVAFVLVSLAVSVTGKLQIRE